MTIWSRAMVAVFVLGCRTPPDPIASPEPPPPRAPDAIPPDPPPAPRPTVAAEAPRLAVPSWVEDVLDDRDLEAFRLRAKRKLRGDLRESADADALLASGDGSSSQATLIVLEDATRGRPRVLCRGSWGSVAAYVDDAQLHEVTRYSNTFASPERVAPTTVDATTPGLRVAAGMIVVREEVVDGRIRVSYRDDVMKTTGWIDEDHVDVVYNPRGPRPMVPAATHRLIRKSTLSVTPGGESFGTLTARNDSLVALQERRGRHALVIYDAGGVQVTGWISAANLRKKPALMWGTGSGRGFGGGGQRPVHELVALRRGTLLLGPASSQVVGVVTDDREVPCSACETKRPVVTLEACDQTIQVIAALE